MTDDFPELPEFQELTEVAEIKCSPLSVVVDFNDLFSDLGEQRAFDLITKLKDLLA